MMDRADPPAFPPTFPPTILHTDTQVTAYELVVGCELKGDLSPVRTSENGVRGETR